VSLFLSGLERWEFMRWLTASKTQCRDSSVYEVHLFPHVITEWRWLLRRCSAYKKLDTYAEVFMGLGYAFTYSFDFCLNSRELWDWLL